MTQGGSVHEFLPFIVIGLATGAVYGLAAMGLVLPYKTSGVFNSGYGGTAALAALLFYFLHQEHRVPWAVAAAICLLVFASSLGLLLEVEDGKIHRGRVYMNRPTHDGVSIDRFARDINPLADHP